MANNSNVLSIVCVFMIAAAALFIVLEMGGAAAQGCGKVFQNVTCTYFPGNTSYDNSSTSACYNICHDYYLGKPKVQVICREDVGIANGAPYCSCNSC